MVSSYLDLNLGLRNLKLRDTDRAGIGAGVGPPGEIQPSMPDSNMAFKALRQAAAAHAT